MTEWRGASKHGPRSALTHCGGARSAGFMVGAQGAPPLQHWLGGTPTHFKGAGGSGRAAPGLVRLGPGSRGGWRDGCALQHTTRGSVKQRRAPGGLPWRAGAGARSRGGVVRRCFALPLLYAERARGSAGGMMGGADSRAAVRASSRRDSRAAGERAGVGVRARQAGSVTREGAGWAKAGSALARRAACNGGRHANTCAAGRRHT